VASWLMTEEISICIFAASLFRNFSRTLNGTEKFPQVRLVKLGSEPVGRADAELYKRHFSPGCILVNWLACTEAGNIAHSFIDKKTEITEDVVPVGYAVEDKEVLLLDDNGKQVGFNQIGEIAVKSRYLSPGYWRRPDLTQAKFLPDPKGGDERIYLTGDLGRMHPDGCLEYMGRKDFQVKVRGYRIEAAEIEKALLQLPAIREAVVVAAEDKSGDRRLIAYLVLNSYPAASVSELRSFLKNSLPTYMVPSAFVFLDALPLAPNGKVDRRALPDPGQSRPELDMSLVLPRTPVEQELAKIWAGVLDKECVGIHDNFFDLGGDSLLAVKIISRVRDLWNVDLPLKMLFEKPTIAELAEAIT
jgi:acyl-coenzyme A synthetase/AMP-(fatty) acid ligase/acyl carrier protein